MRGRSWKYRTGKFLRRHAAAVSIAATVAAVLVSVVVFYSWRLAAERDTARREAATATSVASFAVAFSTSTIRTGPPLLVEGHRILLDKRGESHAFTKSARERLATIYERWGKRSEAARYRTASAP